MFSRIGKSLGWAQPGKASASKPTISKPIPFKEPTMTFDNEGKPLVEKYKAQLESEISNASNEAASRIRMNWKNIPKVSDDFRKVINPERKSEDYAHIPEQYWPQFLDYLTKQLYPSAPTVAEKTAANEQIRQDETPSSGSLIAPTLANIAKDLSTPLPPEQQFRNYVPTLAGDSRNPRIRKVNSFQ